MYVAKGDSHDSESSPCNNEVGGLHSTTHVSQLFTMCTNAHTEINDNKCVQVFFLYHWLTYFLTERDKNVGMEGSYSFFYMSIRRFLRERSWDLFSSYATSMIFLSVDSKIRLFADECLIY